MKDLSGNSAGRNPSIGTVPAMTTVLIETVHPTVTSVTVPSDDTYVAGDDLTFTVNWSEDVTVTGTPRLGLTLGSSTVYADYVSGSGSTALVFKYTVQTGDADGDGVAVRVTMAAPGRRMRAVLPHLAHGPRAETVARR